MKAREISCVEAAELMSCSEETVRSLILSGALHAWRLTERGRWRIDVRSVDRYVAKRRKLNAHGGRRR